MTQPAYTLVNPQNGKLAISLATIGDNIPANEVQRHSHYSIIWIKKGAGVAKVDFTEYDLTAGQMYFLAPYQPYMLTSPGPLEGVMINFHPDFFCIYRHQKEVDCHGVLFHNVYEPPMLQVPGDCCAKFDELIEQMKQEIMNAALAQNEILVSLLKIWLVYASRIKAEQETLTPADNEQNKDLAVLQLLKNAIEDNYRSKHAPADYACILDIPAKMLGKTTKKYFNKTVTDLISERIIIEAKRELYLTQKPVKEIGYELGFDDEYYFSRFFKNHTDVSPKTYRATVLPYQYQLLVR